MAGSKTKSKPKKATPLMGQYNKIKAQHPDAILLFRVGDFYETFSTDAIKAAAVLGIVLTKRANGSASHIELAGFPHHSINTYLPKLVKAGLRVAICEQLEDPKKTKALVKRGVTELVTPGLAVGEQMVAYNKNNFLAAVYNEKENYGLALLDLSTGEFLISQGSAGHIDKLLQSFQPAELLVARNKLRDFKQVFGEQFYTYPLDEWIFSPDFGQDKLLTHFDLKSLKGFGIEREKMGIAAAGSILHYLGETEHHRLGHISKVSSIQGSNYLWLDRFSIRNLELIDSLHPDGVSLFDVLNNTRTAMGARLLRKWILMPLMDISKINGRLDAVTALLKETENRDKLGQLIAGVGDLERLLAKVAMGRAAPRDLGQIRSSLQLLPEIKLLMKSSAAVSLQEGALKIDLCADLLAQLEKQLAAELPVSLQKGEVICQGVSAELDELRAIGTNGKKYLTELQQREAERTGISSLKIGFNNVFGYYFEVTNKHKDKAPEEWTRKQTLVNAERYITEELKDWEDKILGAQEKISALESQLYDQLLSATQQYIKPLQQNAASIAELDCLCCFSENALANIYRRPELNDSLSIELVAGRHPVIEKQLPAGEAYVPNDLLMGSEDAQVILVTGPNMSGKSALLRQTALISLMAQIGSFVPAEKAKLGLIDRIFTRVGASDNISTGESTFMVEMNETASIMNNLSARSLVLLDEIGRGTSTYDGISIAWSLVEYLHQEENKQPKTLFATHYHELSQLEESLPRVRNFHVTTKEADGKVLFLRKLAAGETKHSFGIHVAKMAGMPKEIVERSKEILAKLEQKAIGGESLESQLGDLTATTKARARNTTAAAGDFQLSIFQLDDPNLQQIKEMLNAVDIDELKPIDALLKLHELKKLINESKIDLT